MTQALILSGGGRYADPWHPFGDTSACLAGVLEKQGIRVEVSDHVDDRLEDLSEVDLLVVNAGDPSPDDPAPTPLVGARAGLLSYLGRGGAVLSMHAAASSLPGIPEWESVMGGRWVRGVAMHPAAGLAQVRVYPQRHPIVATSESFVLHDERYSYLRVSPDVVPLATHEHDDIEHPLIWARRYGNARVVYDGLGHDPRSYDSPEHREIVARAARWLLGALE